MGFTRSLNLDNSTVCFHQLIILWAEKYQFLIKTGFLIYYSRAVSSSLCAPVNDHKSLCILSIYTQLTLYRIERFLDVTFMCYENFQVVNVAIAL